MRELLASVLMKNWRELGAKSCRCSGAKNGFSFGGNEALISLSYLGSPFVTLAWKRDFPLNDLKEALGL